MHLDSLPPFLAGIFGFTIEPYMIAIVVPVAGMIFAGVMAICGMYFKHQKDLMWHETARIALEKGQPLPTPPDGRTRGDLRPRHERNDVRAGLILIAVSAGLYIFLFEVAGNGAYTLALIPGFIGVALLLLGLFASKASKNNVAPDDLPPRS